MKLYGQARRSTAPHGRSERQAFGRVRQEMIHLQRAVTGDDWVEAHDDTVDDRCSGSSAIPALGVVTPLPTNNSARSAATLPTGRMVPTS